MNNVWRMCVGLVLLLGVALAACRPAATLTPTAGAEATPTSASPTATSPAAAATPALTATQVARPTPPPILEGTPVPSPEEAQPAAIPRVRQPEGTLNILLLGSDEHNADDGTFRTDVVLIVCIFPDDGAVRVISVPRDFYAWIPTWGWDRINTAYQHGEALDYPGGGPGLLKATIAYNLGLPIHYYALVDFQGYEQLVDAVGGVTITLDAPFDEWLPDEDAPDGIVTLHLEPGTHHLDGATALLYVRARQLTSDFDRNRRQLQVLRSVYTQAMGRNLYRYVPELWDTFRDNVETDLRLPALLSLARLAPQFDASAIGMRQITAPEHLTPWTTPTGGAVLLPDYDALAAFLREAALPPPTTRAVQRGYRVEIVDASGVTGCGAWVAGELETLGFAVPMVTTASAPQEATAIEDYTTTTKGSPLPLLFEQFGIAAEVYSQPQPERTVDFRLVLGRDFTLCPVE